MKIERIEVKKIIHKIELDSEEFLAVVQGLRCSLDFSSHHNRYIGGYDCKVIQTLINQLVKEPVKEA